MQHQRVSWAAVWYQCLMQGRACHGPLEFGPGQSQWLRLAWENWAWWRQMDYKALCQNNSWLVPDRSVSWVKLWERNPLEEVVDQSSERERCGVRGFNSLGNISVQNCWAQVPTSGYEPWLVACETDGVVVSLRGILVLEELWDSEL